MVIVMLGGVTGYGFSTLFSWWVMILIVSVGSNRRDIWGTYRLIGLEAEGGSVSGVRKLIFGGGGVILDS